MASVDCWTMLDALRNGGPLLWGGTAGAAIGTMIGILARHAKQQSAQVALAVLGVLVALGGGAFAIGKIAHDSVEKAAARVAQDAEEEAAERLKDQRKKRAIEILQALRLDSLKAVGKLPETSLDRVGVLTHGLTYELAWRVLQPVYLAYGDVIEEPLRAPLEKFLHGEDTWALRRHYEQALWDKELLTPGRGNEPDVRRFFEGVRKSYEELLGRVADSRGD